MPGPGSPHVHIPFARLAGFSGLLRAGGLSLELYVSSLDLDALAPDWLEKTAPLLDYAPEISLHAPFMDLSPGAVDDKVRAVTVERFEKTLDMASALHALAVVFHSGYEKWKYAHRADIWLDSSLRTWGPLIEKARENGTRIAIENIFEDTPDNLVMLMERLGSPGFGICFDAGHFNLFSKERSLADWLGPLKEHIIELHLHDNTGGFDSHMPIGEGTFPFRLLFDELHGSDDIIYTIEAHSKEDVFISLARLAREFGPKEF